MIAIGELVDRDTIPQEKSDSLDPVILGVSLWRSSNGSRRLDSMGIAKTASEK